MDQNESIKQPNLAAPDFQNTLNGELPGNVAAEHGTLPGASPELVIGQDHSPESLNFHEQLTAFEPNGDETETQAETDRQLQDYTDNTP